ncbi:hypothetical protein RDABS01_033182 [Bienertia sinuspersici]
MHCMCGSPLNSRLVFYELKVKNLFVWNAVICCYTKNKLYDDSILMFCELLSRTELKPDNFPFLTVHELAVKLEMVLDVFVGNALIMMYGKYGLLGDAIKVFENLHDRNLVSWNSLIRVYSEHGFSVESILVFVKMLEDDCYLVPDIATVVTVLPSCAGERDIEIGMMLHGLAVKLGLSY